MQSQLVCSGCRTILLYLRGATNVCCAVCNNLTPVPPPGMEIAQLICGCCRTSLMHPRGATSVRCACCTVNLVPDGRTPVFVQTSNNGATSSAGPTSSTATGRSQNQTVVVHNPMSLDEIGKLASSAGTLRPQI